MNLVYCYFGWQVCTSTSRAVLCHISDEETSLSEQSTVLYRSPDRTGQKRTQRRGRREDPFVGTVGRTDFVIGRCDDESWQRKVLPLLTSHRTSNVNYTKGELGIILFFLD